MNIISNEPNEIDSQCGTTEMFDENIFKKTSTFRNNKPCHTLQINRQSISLYYREKSFDVFSLLIVDPTQKLDYEESKIIPAYFGLSEKKSKEVILNMVLNRF